MSASIASCDCGNKTVTQSGKRVELSECKCPWPAMDGSNAAPVRCSAWIEALAETWRRRESEERAEAARWGTGLLGSMHSVKADLIAELRAEMESASIDV